MRTHTQILEAMEMAKSGGLNIDHVASILAVCQELELRLQPEPRPGCTLYRDGVYIATAADHEACLEILRRERRLSPTEGTYRIYKHVFNAEDVLSLKILMRTPEVSS